MDPRDLAVRIIPCLDVDDGRVVAFASFALATWVLADDDTPSVGFDNAAAAGPRRRAGANDGAREQ